MTRAAVIKRVISDRVLSSAEPYDRRGSVGTEAFSFKLADALAENFGNWRRLQGLRVNAYIERRRRANQRFLILRIYLEFERQACFSDPRYARMHFEDLIERRRRLELQRSASQDCVHAERDQILPRKAHRAEVLRPGVVIVSHVVSVEYDALQISISEADSDVMMEAEV